MTAIVPDTLQGALILSAIDFVTSFVIISGIGAVLALFPLLNRIGSLRKHPVATPPALAAAAPPAGLSAEDRLEDAEHIAAIAAAVHAVLGGQRRIVRIEPNGPTKGGDGWTAEGRQAHRSSHLRQG